MGDIQRPRYSPGLILEDQDLTAAVDYTRDLNRLLFRSLFGCGVICGLDVTVKVDCGLVVTVNPGLALDGCGDPIHLTGQQPITLDKRTGVLADAVAGETPKQKDFWVIACNREKNCAPRSVVCDGDDLDCSSQPTRTRSAVEISVTFEPPVCGCSNKIFTDKQDSKTLPKLAEDMRARQEELSQERRDDMTRHCRDSHNQDPACPRDCGCGTACSCGCCVLLAWVHWFDDKDRRGWKVLHQGVRRFVRPLLMCDPTWDWEPPKTTGAERPAGTAKSKNS